MPAAGFTKLSTEEIHLAKKWYSENVAPSEIASRLGRSKTTLTRLLVQQVARRPLGRRAALSKAQIDLLVRRLDELIRRSQNRYTVTVAMLKRSTRIRASEKTISKALHEKNIFFRKLREKLVLAETDIDERFDFATIYGCRAFMQASMESSSRCTSMGQTECLPRSMRPTAPFAPLVRVLMGRM